MQAVDYVVLITGTDANNNPVHGTGFLISKTGHVLTCHHVVNGIRDLKVRLPLMAPWKYQIATPLPEHDLAVLVGVVPPGVPTPRAKLDWNWQKTTPVGAAVAVWGHSAR